MDLLIRCFILEEGEGGITLVSMDDDDLLLLIEQVYGWPPSSWLYELRVDELRCLFVDSAFFLNSVCVLAIFYQLFVNFTS